MCCREILQLLQTVCYERAYNCLAQAGANMTDDTTIRHTGTLADAIMNDPLMVEAFLRERLCRQTAEDREGILLDLSCIGGYGALSKAVQRLEDNP